MSRVVYQVQFLGPESVLPPTIEIFDFGKYRGESHRAVLEKDPAYVCWAYERVEHRAGISSETYAAACTLSGMTRRQRDQAHRKRMQAERRTSTWHPDEGAEYEEHELMDPPRNWGDLDD